jgi:elongation factor Ts
VAKIPMELIKQLREMSGAGMMDCKAALQEAGGDVEKAVEVLRVKGQAHAAKRGAREATEGVVQSYIHATGKIGVLVEVDCETDFVARNEDFREFAREVAIHVVGARPLYLSDDDVPEEARQAELRIYEEQAQDKPEEIRAKVAEGRLRKWLDEVVLLRQPHVNADKHKGQTIEELRAAVAAEFKENVLIRRFARFEVGGE